MIQPNKSDVGISAEGATEALQEAADVILLKKDLNILEEGILEGRKVFVNMSKYIRITASSNFGNILAAYYSKKMGLPIDRFICASNENNVLSDFFKTGTYDKRSGKVP